MKQTDKKAVLWYARFISQLDTNWCDERAKGYNADVVGQRRDQMIDELVLLCKKSRDVRNKP